MLYKWDMVGKIPYTSSEVTALNKTARYGARIGAPSKVARCVAKYAHPSFLILDYGAGKKMLQTRDLQNKGFIVEPYDIGDNETPYHVMTKKNFYDLVYASKVLNVQPSTDLIYHVFEHVNVLLKERGAFIFDYPLPHKTTLGLGSVIRAAMDVFLEFTMIGGSIKDPVICVRKGE